MIYFWMSMGILMAQNSSDSIPVAKAFPAEAVVEKGYDGKSEDPMLPISVSILSPKPQETVTTNEVDFFFQVQNYSLAPYGNRLHAILDNQSPVVVDQLRRPLTLKDLPAGGHTLRVYAVKPDGRMVSDSQAFSMVYFYVIKKDYQNYINPNTPFLTVNMPLSGPVDAVEDGTVWLDYRIHSLPDQAKGLKVRYRLSNIQAVDEIGKGIFWKNLKVGRYDVVAELLDGSGNVVSGLFNKIQRSFEVRPVQKAISTSPADLIPQQSHE
jgi:hypothetical protein